MGMGIAAETLRQTARHPLVSGRTPSQLFWFTDSAAFATPAPSSSGSGTKILPAFLKQPKAVFQRIWKTPARKWVCEPSGLTFQASGFLLCFRCKALVSLNEYMEIQFTTRIFKEGRSFVAHALELDVSSCGGTKEKALKNLKQAVSLFLEEAEKMGTLEQILEEAGYTKRKARIDPPKFISVLRLSLPLPLTHAKV